MRALGSCGQGGFEKEARKSTDIVRKPATQGVDRRKPKNPSVETYFCDDESERQPTPGEVEETLYVLLLQCCNGDAGPDGVCIHSTHFPWPFGNCKTLRAGFGEPSSLVMDPTSYFCAESLGMISKQPSLMKLSWLHFLCPAFSTSSPRSNVATSLQPETRQPGQQPAMETSQVCN
ncbi:hypothetical protein GOP47_0011439 [Adiantum capillus-veneris]|uniref:Uncharacterized protein n=1 Tax=Adiantum capillus-veneris TaxID=13818 RepID=A0A9D4UT99_ADICA|nr:hypothetical protein GOP47_0011439 [Adiantum capillus-veneris]